MNHRTFLVALVLIAAVALVIAATDDEPAHPTTQTAPAFRHGPQGPRGMGRPQGPRRRLSPERVEALMVQLQTDLPGMHEHLAKLRRENPRAFEEAIVGVDRFVRRLGEMPEDIRQTMIQQRQDQVERYRLAKEYRATTDPKLREEIRAEIRGLVGRLFDADQKLAKFKIEQLTKELEQLKKDLEDRDGRRDTLISEAVERLVK